MPNSQCPIINRPRGGGIRLDFCAPCRPSSTVTQSRPMSWTLLTREPFRLFFPLAVLAGMAGAALWPMHFAGLVEFYPGQSHARVMTYGFFTGFFIGFLGTALP